MTQTHEQLSRQNATLGSIRGIVRTMKTLSALNAVPYEQAADAIAAYEATVERAFAAFAFCTQGRYGIEADAVSHSRLLVVFGSDHGLCGNYNEQLADHVVPFCQSRSGASVQLLCIGGKMEQALADRDLSCMAVLSPPASVAGVGRLANDLVRHIERFAGDATLIGQDVHLAFTQREGPHRGVQHISGLLPLPKRLFVPVRRWPSTSLPMFTQEEAPLLAALVRNYLFVRLYRASAEAMVTENAARLALMQQAEQNVTERLDSVQRAMNHMRQEDITTELMDIITGYLDDPDDAGYDADKRMA